MQNAATERGRAELDRQRAVARKDPTRAHLYQHSLGGVGTHASVVICIPHKDGVSRSYMTCELSAAGEGLVLVIVCPCCLFRHHRPQSESQITMRSEHRRFSLDPIGQGELWVSRQDPSVTVTLAGAIETHEVQTCPVCSFKFHLEKSRDASERGVTVIREN